MEPLLITSYSVDRPGTITLRGAANSRQPWTPTPRLVVDVHTICWYTIGASYGRRIPPTQTMRADGEVATTDEGYVLPFMIGTSFGQLQFTVPVTAVVKGEFVPLNTDLISELIEQFSGVL